MSESNGVPAESEATEEEATDEAATEVDGEEVSEEEAKAMAELPDDASPEEIQRALATLDRQKRAAGIEEIPIELNNQIIGELTVRNRFLEIKLRQANEFSAALMREKQERDQREAEALARIQADKDAEQESKRANRKERRAQQKRGSRRTAAAAPTEGDSGAADG